MKAIGRKPGNAILAGALILTLGGGGFLVASGVTHAQETQTQIKLEQTKLDLNDAIAVKKNKEIGSLNDKKQALKAELTGKGK